MNKNPLWSIIIPTRNEFPHVAFTIHSIINCLEADGWNYKDFEIIIVDNGSNDDVYEQRGTKGTTSYLEPRGAYYNRILRVIRDPLLGNHSARNTGARIARGEYLFFSDAHMSYRPGFFKYIKQAIDESGGLAHGSVLWMGAYPPTDSSLGFSYTWKLGQEMKQTWNNYKLADDWWYILGQGAWGVGVKRKQFLDFGGWENPHRTYGAEYYLSSKWWMLGSSVVVHPKAIGYHLSSGRGYQYNHDDYKENILGCAYALGADDWRERTYINYLRKTNKAVMDQIMARGEVEYAKDRQFIEKHRKMTFNEMLKNKPWDIKNLTRFGVKNGEMSIFHWSWLDELRNSAVAVEAYKNSKYQKELHKFITEELADNIYRRGKYTDLTRFQDLL